MSSLPLPVTLPIAETFTGDALPWSPAAPEAVLRAAAAGDSAAAWSAWQKHLRSRKRPRPPARLLAGKRSPLLWGLGDQPPSEIVELVERLNRKPRRLADDGEELSRIAESWLSDAAAEPRWPAYALECLAWAWTLPALANVLDADLWQRLHAHLAGATAPPNEAERVEHPLAAQLLCGELPLTLAYQLPEMATERELSESSRSFLSASLAELLDGEGLPRAANLPLLRPMLACWTRCAVLAAARDEAAWTAEAQQHFDWCVRQSLRLMRADGSQVFGKPSRRHDRKLFETAIKRSAAAHSAATYSAAGAPTGGSPDDAPPPTNRDHKLTRRLATALLADRHPKLSAAKLPQPAVESEWAELALLRSDWGPRSPRLAVAHHDRQVRLELSLDGELIVAGAWTLEVRLDGVPQEQISDWENICWVSDEDVDYLELEARLAGGLRVQRQIMLAREDRVLLLADAVLGDDRHAIAYTSSLPLAVSVTAADAGPTRELYLSGRRPRALVLPLALPEWRSDPRGGTLSSTETALQLSQVGAGTALFAPLWFDFKPRRMHRECTWRQLTIAAHREMLPREAAVGYRVQVGAKQWLIYRSLGPCDNRTVLGHNLTTEFLVGRFSAEGLVSSLVEIE